MRTDAPRLRPVFFLCILVLAAELLPGAAPAADRPNVVWITVEDMSPTLGCWGDGYATTPHIDQLARESVKFTRVFATAPVCSPVRSCLITGCYATSLGTQRLRSKFPIPTLMNGFPALLRESGYYTTNNVKTDYNTSNEKAIIAASWDDCSKTAHWRNRPEGKPFFAVFNHMTTHQSRTMVMPYSEFQKKVQGRLGRAKIHDPRTAPVPPYYPDTPLIRKSMARYYDCVSVMDQEVGEILKQLNADGLAENTIVFFYSDHGSGMPRHKRALLDSGMHVPLLIRFPKQYQYLAPSAPGTAIDQLVSFVDFAPTMLSLCGTDIPPFMQGLPLLGPQRKPPRQYVYGARDRVDEVYDVARSVRSGRYLYIRNFMPHLSYHQPSYYADQGVIRAEISRYAQQHAGHLSPAQAHYTAPTRPVEELYDVATDPQNLKNLAEAPEQRDMLVTMRAALTEWILATRDLGFLPEEEMWPRLLGNTPYEIRQNPQRYPLKKLFQAASRVGFKDVDAVTKMTAGLGDAEPGVRYWSAIGLVAAADNARGAKSALLHALDDSSPAVRIEAANALARIGDVETALNALRRELEGDNLDAVLHAARTLELIGDPSKATFSAMRAARKRANGPGDQKMFIRFATDALFESIGKSP